MRVAFLAAGLAGRLPVVGSGALVVASPPRPPVEGGRDHQQHDGERQQDAQHDSSVPARACPQWEEVAILLASMVPIHLPLADVKNRLSEVVAEVERSHSRVVITKHGRPVAVLLSVDDLESLEETLEVMSDPELMAQIAESEADIKAGRGIEYTKEELLELVRRSR